MFEKYVHKSIDLIIDGIVDGKKGQKLKTAVPQTDLNMVNWIMKSFFFYFIDIDNSSKQRKKQTT